MLYRIVVKQTNKSTTNPKLEKGMNVEISYTERELSPTSVGQWSIGELRKTVAAAFKSKYNIDLTAGFIDSDYLELQKLG